jgi:hypothetical protein
MIFEANCGFTFLPKSFIKYKTQGAKSMFWIGLFTGLFLGVAAGIFVAALGRVSAENQEKQRVFEARFSSRGKVIGEELKTDGSAG